MSPAGDVRCGHIKNAIVITDGRRPDAARSPTTIQWKLTRPGQAVPDLLPVDQVAAVEDRDAGEIFEGAGDEVKIPSNAANAGVGVKAGEDRVVISHITAVTR